MNTTRNYLDHEYSHSYPWQCTDWLHECYKELSDHEYSHSYHVEVHWLTLWTLQGTTLITNTHTATHGSALADFMNATRNYLDYEYSRSYPWQYIGWLYERYKELSWSWILTQLPCSSTLAGFMNATRNYLDHEYSHSYHVAIHWLASWTLQGTILTMNTHIATT